MSDDAIEKATEALIEALTAPASDAVRGTFEGEAALLVKTRIAVCAIMDATIARLKDVPGPIIENLKAEGHIEQAVALLEEVTCLPPNDPVDGTTYDKSAILEPAIEHIVKAAVVEAGEVSKIRIALRQVAEFEHRTDRERTLLHDLVEALGGEARG